MKNNNKRNTMSTYQFFVNNTYKKVLVNDKFYDCRIGIQTDGGYYKNGYVSKQRTGLKGKHEYIWIYIYTSVKGYIDVEEKILMRNDGRICKWYGWDNIDLLKVPSQDHTAECMSRLNYFIK